MNIQQETIQQDVTSIIPVQSSSPNDNIKVSKKISDRNNDIVDILIQTLKEFSDDDPSEIVESFKSRLLVLTTQHCKGTTKDGNNCLIGDPFLKNGYCCHHIDGKSCGSKDQEKQITACCAITIKGTNCNSIIGRKSSILDDGRKVVFCSVHSRSTKQVNLNEDLVKILNS